MVNLGMHKEYAMWKVVIKKYEKNRSDWSNTIRTYHSTEEKGTAARLLNVPLKSGGLHLSIDRQLGAGC